MRRLVVALVDPQSLRRESLARALEGQTRSVRVLRLGTAAELSGVAAAGPQPNLVLLCVSGSGAARGGIEREIGAVRAARSDLPVVVVAESESAQAILAAVQQGARGYLPTSLGVDIVARAIGLVAAGGTFVPAEVLLSHLDDNARSKGVEDPLPTMNGSSAAKPMSSSADALASLNEQQLSVLDLLRLGQSNRSIAQTLNLSEATVKFQVRQIAKRLGVTNRTQVALWLIR